jgi:hypothetical protein
MATGRGGARRPPARRPPRRRFAHLRLPRLFYEDFARVADDESRHFCWTLQRLHELGADYGDMVCGWQGGGAGQGRSGAGGERS